MKRRVKFSPIRIKRKASRYLGITKYILILALIGGILYVSTKSDLFMVKSVALEGTKGFVNSTDAREIAKGLVMDKNIFAVNLSKVENSLQETFQGIKYIDVSRKLPNEIRVTIVERNPLAVVQTQDENLYMIDEDGYVLGVVEEGKNNLPKVYYDGSIQVGTFVDRNFVPIYLRLISALDAEKIAASSISVDTYDVTFSLKEDIEVKASREADMNKLVRILSTLLKQLSVEGRSPKKVDLRYDKVIVSY